VSDSRVLERENTRASHTEHVALLVKAYHAAGDNEAQLRALLTAWAPAAMQPGPDRPNPHELLKKSLRNHVRWECRLRSVYCPTDMQVIG
jgi:hypothetical protein